MSETFEGFADKGNIETIRRMYVDEEQLELYEVVTTGGVVTLQCPEDPTYKIVFSPHAAFKVGRALIEASQDPTS